MKMMYKGKELIGGNSGGITQEQADSRYLQLSGGVMAGDVNMGINKITSSAVPSNNNDIVNKKYVDDSITSNNESLTTEIENNLSTSISSTYVAKAGATMSGELNMGNHKITSVASPTQDGDVVNKEYLDTSINNLNTTISSTYVTKTNSTMSGPLNMSANKISNLAAPTENTDAVTKKYVDDLVSNSINESITQALGGSY